MVTRRPPPARRAVSARSAPIPRSKPAVPQPRGATGVAVRDADASRARILEAATVEFAGCGLAGARVDRIATAAGANKRMLYYYFGNKEALYLAVLEAAYARIRAAERDLLLTGLAPDQAVRRLVRFTWDYFREHPEFITLLNNENLHKARHLHGSARIRAMNSPLIATLQLILERGRAQGIFKPGADALQLYISIAALSYFYLSNMATLSVVFARDLATPAARRRRVEHMQDMVVASLVVGTPAAAPSRSAA